MSTPPRVVAILPHLIPSTTLTVVKPLLALHQAGDISLNLTLENWVSPRHIEAADVLVFSRNMQPMYRHTLDTALALHKPFIYDIDDNFFELPASYRHDVSEHQQRLALLETYLRAAALVRVYAAPMQERVQTLNPRVTRVDSLVDWSLLPSAFPQRDPRRVRIVYATSRMRQDDLATLFLTAMHKVLATYPDTVEFYCWGYHPPEFRNVPAVRFLNYVHNYDTFFRRFARAGFDIGLAPLRDEVFYRSKTNNKFREYAACRIAGVYSDVDVYSSCVEHERSGLLVPNTAEAWFHAIARLVEEPALRTSIQERAFSYVRAHYNLEKAQQEWLTQIHHALQLQRSVERGSLGVAQPAMPAGEPALLPSLRARFMREGRRFVQGLHEGGSPLAVRKIVQALHNLWNQFYLQWLVLRAR